MHAEMFSASLILDPAMSHNCVTVSPGIVTVTIWDDEGKDH